METPLNDKDENVGLSDSNAVVRLVLTGDEDGTNTIHKH